MTVSPFPPALPLKASSPDPDLVTLVATLIRAILQLAAGLGIAVGAQSDSMITIIASAIVAIGTIVWSIVQKYRATQRDHAGSVASAAKGYETGRDDALHGKMTPPAVLAVTPVMTAA